MDRPHAFQGATTRDLVLAVQRSGPDAGPALNLLLAANEGLCKALVARLRPDEENLDDDLLQGARLGFVAAVHKFDPGRDTKLATFAWPFMWYAALRTVRRREAESAGVVPLVWSSVDTKEQTADVVPEPEIGGLPFEERVALYDALEALPLADRSLLGRIYWRDQTQQEVAAALGLTQQGVSKRHRRILATLHYALSA